MVGKSLKIKEMLIHFLMVTVLFFGSAEAKGIEAGLWGIDWKADANQVRQSLEGQRFILLEQGSDAKESNWQKYGDGLFSGFQSDIKVVWQAKRLTEINIESTGVFLLGTEFTYRNLVERFTNEYGQPQETDGYMLKMFPGVWVESAKWTVVDKGSPAFTVTVVQNSPAVGSHFESAAPAKIYISFTRN